MAETAEEILRELRFSRGEPDAVARQVLRHLDETNWTEVMRALEMLASAGWTDAEAAFRGLVLARAEDWLAECRALPLVERLVATMTTLRVLGEPTPDVSDLAEKAEEALRKLRVN